MGEDGGGGAEIFFTLPSIPSRRGRGGGGLDFSIRLGYFDPDEHKKLQGLRQEVGNLLWRFYKSL